MTELATGSLTVAAPAKINLTLDVLGKRPDGYHDIASVMQTISLCDEITAVLTPQSGVALTVHGRYAAGVPSDDGNLAFRAAAMLLDVFAYGRGADVTLVKNIPCQAGLGGGSSDAAATLMAVNRLLGSPLTRNELLPFAADLGADVPFFLYGGAATVGGIGERVTPGAAGLTEPFLIVKPNAGVSTAAAYAALDVVVDRFSTNATGRWPEGGMSNDFEAVIYGMAPDIERTRQALLTSGAERVLLCGSGSALAAFSADSEALKYEMLRAGFGVVWVVSPVNTEVKWA